MGVFAERVAARFGTGPRERAFLERLEEHPRRLPPNRIIVEEGDRATHAFVLMSGWVISFSRFTDGSHQVRRLHFSGDLLAMPSVPMRRHAESLETLSGAVVAPFPKSMLLELFDMPRLAAIMYMFAQAERITAGDRLTSLGHNSAKGRIAFLIIDILHRLRSSDAGVGDTFVMHLSREEMARVSGISPVHASRTWSALIRDGLIECGQRTVTVRDEARLIELGHYTDREDFDRAWLRQVAESAPGPFGAKEPTSAD